MPIHIKGSGGAAKPSSVYDAVIDTQAKFDNLVASSDWLGAHSVMFLGHFTNTGTVIIPSSVYQISGAGTSSITITDGGHGFNYASKPTTNDYSIDGLKIIGIGNTIYGFARCIQLTNCTADCTGCTGGTGYAYFTCDKLVGCVGYGGGNNARGFSLCNQIVSCVGIGTGSQYGYGFRECNQIADSEGRGEGAANNGYGFSSCVAVSNCKGTGKTTDSTKIAYGFATSNQLSNCIGIGEGTGSASYGFLNCVQMANCSGTGLNTGAGTGYGFSGGSYYNGCKQDTASKTGFLTGTNLKVDTATVAAT